MDLHYSPPVERRGRATRLSHRVMVAGFTVLAALANFTASGPRTRPPIPRRNVLPQH